MKKLESNDINFSINFIREQLPVMIREFAYVSRKAMLETISSIQKQYEKSVDGRWQKVIDIMINSPLTRVMVAENVDIYIDFCEAINAIRKSNDHIDWGDKYDNKITGSDKPVLNSIEFKKLRTPSSELDVYNCIKPAIKTQVRVYETNRSNKYWGADQDTFYTAPEMRFNGTHIDEIGDVHSNLLITGFATDIDLHIDYEVLLEHLRKFMMESKILENYTKEKNVNLDIYPPKFDQYICLKECFDETPEGNERFKNLLEKFEEEVCGRYVFSSICTLLPTFDKITNVYKSLPSLFVNKVISLEHDFLNSVFESSFIGDGSKYEKERQVFVGERLSQGIVETSIILKTLYGNRNFGENFVTMTFARNMLQMLYGLLCSTENYYHIPVSNDDSKKLINIISASFDKYRIQMTDENVEFCRKYLKTAKTQQAHYFRSVNDYNLNMSGINCKKLISSTRAVINLLCFSIYLKYHLTNSSFNSVLSGSGMYLNDTVIRTYKESLYKTQQTVKRALTTATSILSDYVKDTDSKMYESVKVFGFDRDMFDVIKNDESNAYEYMFEMYNDYKKHLANGTDKNGYGSLVGVVPRWERETISNNNMFVRYNLLNEYYGRFGKQLNSRHYTNGVVSRSNDGGATDINNRYNKHVKEMDVYALYLYTTRHFANLVSDYICTGHIVDIVTFWNTNNNYLYTKEEYDNQVAYTDIHKEYKEDVVDSLRFTGPLVDNQTSTESLDEEFKEIKEYGTQDMFGLFQDGFCSHFNNKVVATADYMNDTDETKLSEENLNLFRKEVDQYRNFVRKYYTKFLAKRI